MHVVAGGIFLLKLLLELLQLLKVLIAVILIVSLLILCYLQLAIGIKNLIFQGTHILNRLLVLSEGTKSGIGTCCVHGCRLTQLMSQSILASIILRNNLQIIVKLSLRTLETSL